MQLTQKETSLLKDLKGQEKLCVDKYTRSATCAVDPQLKNLFTQISQIEQQHLDTISKIEGGSTPQMGGNALGNFSFTATYNMTDTPDKQTDSYLCTDCLSMEKHASHLYDTSIFEFKDETLRNTLNQIQKEEQVHGKKIYDYMSMNGMYS